MDAEDEVEATRTIPMIQGASAAMDDAVAATCANADRDIAATATVVAAKERDADRPTNAADPVEADRRIDTDRTIAAWVTPVGVERIRL